MANSRFATRFVSGLLPFARPISTATVVTVTLCLLGLSSTILGQPGRVAPPKADPTESNTNKETSNRTVQPATTNDPKAVAPKAPTVTDLAVEVQYNPGPSHAYIVVDRAEKHWIWFGRFARVDGWVAPASSERVSAVKINAQQAEEGVRVWVSVLSGQVLENEKQISSYVLREGERVAAKELTDVGVVPFELKTVRLAGAVAYVPDFKSKSRSIELASIRPNFSALPSLQLVLRNVSSKSVRAVEVLTVVNGVRDLMMMPQGKDDDALIPPGGTYEVKVALKSRHVPNADGYSIETQPNQSIEIAMATFDDGSYEGNSDYAMTFLGYVKGRKAQLARVIDLLDAASGTTDVTTLKNKLSALNLEADPQAVQSLLQQFPQEKRSNHVQIPVQVGMRRIRDEVLNDLSQFELHSRFLEADAFNTWLGSARQRYKAWLARL